MFRIKIESTISPNYPLLGRRLALLLLEPLCLAFSVTNAVALSAWGVADAWISTAVFALLALLLTIIDLIIHTWSASPPGSDAGGSKSTTPVRGPASSQAVQPRDGLNDYEDADAGLIGATEAERDAASTSGENASLLADTESATDSEKGYEGTSKTDDDRPYKPSKIVLFLDAMMVFSFLALYITTLVLETLNWDFKGYALKFHTSLIMLAIMGLHFGCARVAFRSLRRQPKAPNVKKYKAVPKGVISI